MYRFLGRSVFTVALLIVAAVSISAQKDGTLTCRKNSGNWYGERLIGNCEIREQTLALSGTAIGIDGRQNGGVVVKGWDQNQVLIRARVQTAAPTAEEAAELAKQVRIETAGAKIHASGPESNKNLRWDVSYEVFVPRRSDLSVETHNGGIVIADVSGNIDFNATNGGVVLRKVGGNVRGSTTNG